MLSANPGLFDADVLMVWSKGEGDDLWSLKAGPVRLTLCVWRQSQRVSLWAGTEFARETMWKKLLGRGGGWDALTPRAAMDTPRLSGDQRNGDDGDLRGGIVTKTEPKTKKPSLYKVLLLNDDYTPMEFVVFVLERFFNKAPDEANRIMMHVHQKGVGICGVYTYEVAETKVAQVMNFSRQHQHPLQCTMEKE
jgi:ATP-dependent Clp protease adaptor protein ClpS